MNQNGFSGKHSTVPGLFRKEQTGGEDCRVHENDEKGDPVDPEQIGDLDHREHPVLGIAEKLPGKTGESPGPDVFKADPEGRGQQNQNQGFDPRTADGPGEQTGVEGKVQGKEQHDGNAENQRNVAVGVQRVDDPVKKAEVVNQAEAQAGYQALTAASLPERIQERNKGDPGEDVKSGFGKGQGKKKPRKAGKKNTLEVLAMVLKPHNHSNGLGLDQRCRPVQP